MDALYSASIKGGGRTYFVDVKEAKNKSKYLTIAESKPSKEGEKKYTRSSVMIFDGQIERFQEVLKEAFKTMSK